MFWKRKKKTEQETRVAVVREAVAKQGKTATESKVLARNIGRTQKARLRVKPMTMSERMPARNILKTSPPHLEKKVSQEEIAMQAYKIWQREGCPEGRAAEHWKLAMKELINK